MLPFSEYEIIDEIMGRIMSYAQLVYAEDVSDPEAGRFYQSMQERVNDISADVLFFSLELNEIEDHLTKADEGGHCFEIQALVRQYSFFPALSVERGD